MKVGVIADIHSNSIAFKACIDYMEKSGCEEYLILGDIISDTANVKETMSLLSKLIKTKPCKVLRGNREEYMLEQRRIKRGEKEGELWIKGSASGNLLYTYEQLSDSELDFFESLPMCFVYEVQGLPAITCCHGSPDRINELLEQDEDRYKEVLDSIDTDYLLAAHTHRQGVVRYKNKTYINTGASGIAIGDIGKAQAVILTGKDNKWEAELLHIPYDVDTVIKEIFELGLYDMAPWFINGNLHILTKGIDLIPELVTTATNLQKEETGKARWPHIEEIYFERAAKKYGIEDYSYLRSKNG